MLLSEITSSFEREKLKLGAKMLVQQLLKDKTRFHNFWGWGRFKWAGVNGQDSEIVCVCEREREREREREGGMMMILCD